MKKKIIIPIIACLVLVIGIIGFIFWNNRTVSTITLDINPSIKINLDKNEKVKSIVALNDDAKEIIDNNIKGKSIEETINTLVDNLIDKGYAKETDTIEIILHSEGKISNNEIKEVLNKNLQDKKIPSDIIVVDKVIKEDEKLAIKYNVSPAKISYIKTIVEENKNIYIEDLVNKPVGELNETKTTGKYCESGYTLEGDWCLKEINRVDAKSDMVCEIGYYEYNGKCYEEEHLIETDKLVCQEEFKLVDGKCIREETIDATPSKYSCSKGMVKTKGEVGIAPYESGPSKELVCVDESSITHPVIPCELPASDPTERTSSGGKCYWHRAPVIEAGCPGKTQIGGFCWDDASNIYLCPNGYNSNKRTKDDYCYTVLKNVNPIVTEYTCEEGYNLENNKCVKKETEDAFYERVCPSGYNKVDNDRCINMNKFKNKVDGYYCEEDNSRLRGNMCIIYDVIEAKHN